MATKTITSSGLLTNVASGVASNDTINVDAGGTVTVDAALTGITLVNSGSNAATLIIADGNSSLTLSACTMGTNGGTIKIQGSPGSLEWNSASGTNKAVVNKGVGGV